MTNGKVNHLLALIRELVIKREISFERIANLNRLPMWKLFLNRPNGQQMNIERSKKPKKRKKFTGFVRDIPE
jgi:hypothetical protein